MKRWRVVGVVLVGAFLVVACSGWGLASKRIDLWPETPVPPAEGPAAAGDQPTAAKTADEELLPAKILKAAAAQDGFPAAHDIVAVTAAALVKPSAPPKPADQPAAAPKTEPPAAKPAGSAPPGNASTDKTATSDAPKPTTEAKQPETPPATAKPVALPPWAAAQPYGAYTLTALAAGEFKHPKGQLLRVALFQFASSQEAWGFWSVGRQEKALTIGQGANVGGELRVWQGQFVGVLSLVPPDPQVDELRLASFAHTLFGLVPGTGTRPEMAAWLPTANQLPHTLTYFHAGGPLPAELLGLGRDTEGVAAQYEIIAPKIPGALPPPRTAMTPAPASTIALAAVVRYPDVARALKAWDGFVGGPLGMDPTEGDRGSRRMVPVGGGWGGIQVRDAIVAFVLGAPSRDQTRVLMLQSLAAAHGTAAAAPAGSY